MSTLNRNMTNDALLANEDVKRALDAGHIVLIDRKATRKPEYTNLYFAGMVEGGGSVTETQAMFLDWDTKFIGRAIQNASTKIAEKMELGKVFDNLQLRMVDSTKPHYAGQDPRENKDGKQLQDSDGNAVYRKFEVVLQSEFTGHKTIEAKVPEVATVN